MKPRIFKIPVDDYGRRWVLRYWDTDHGSLEVRFTRQLTALASLRDLYALGLVVR